MYFLYAKISAQNNYLPILNKTYEVTQKMIAGRQRAMLFCNNREMNLPEQSLISCPKISVSPFE